MTNEILVTGKQTFMNKEIPVVLGGFGEGKKCICDKIIADIHGINTFDVRRRITDNIKRFKENVDFIDLKQGMRQTHTSENEKTDDNFVLNLMLELGYTKSAITQAEHIYLLSERGYAKLIKIMDSDLAWEIHDKLIDEYFTMRDDIIPKMTGLIATLESEVIGLKNELNQITDYITNKVDIGLGTLKKINLDYMECVSDSIMMNKTYKVKNDTIHDIVLEIKKYGGYSSENKVFSRIYKLMNQKCGIDINKCKENYVFQNPDKPDVSPWGVIMNSPILYQTFIDVASEMLNQLKTYGSSDEYIVSTNFDESLEQLKLITKDKFDSNKLEAYKKVYKCMENIFGVDWSSIKYKSKIEAIKLNTDLQALFIKAVNYIQYNNVA